MSVRQWIKMTNVMGSIVKAGRFGGTYAHKDIAFHFAIWLSPEFQIHLALLVTVQTDMSLRFFNALNSVFLCIF